MVDGSSGKMGLASCVALIVGACVGSAIFSISGLTVWQAGPSAILSWILAAVIYFAYGLIVTELAGRYPRSGGVFIFPQRAIGGRKGPIWGFISAWGYIVSNIVAIAFSAIYFSIFLKAGFPGLESESILSIAACLLAFIILIPGGRQSQTIQNALVVVLLVTIAVYCLTAVSGGCIEADNFKGFFTSGNGGRIGFLSAVPLAIVAYGGSIVIAFIAGDVSKPERNVPLALILGIGAVTLIYTAVIVTIVGTLPMESLEASDELKLTPLLASISDGSLSGFPFLTKLVSVSGAIALLTTMIALLRVNARAIQAVSGENMLPPFLLHGNSKGAPTSALCLMTVVCIALCFAGKWAMELISLGAVLNIITMSVTCIALMKSRGKVSLLPVAVIAVFLVCYIPEFARARLWIYTAAVYAAGAAVYAFSKKR